MPLTVMSVPGQVSLSVAVRFAGGPRRSFVVDTGSSQSVVASSVARAAGLAGTDLAQRQATVCSVITVPLVHSGPWSLPGQRLHPQLVGYTGFGSIAWVASTDYSVRTSSSTSDGWSSITAGAGWSWAEGVVL